MKPAGMESDFPTRKYRNLDELNLAKYAKELLFFHPEIKDVQLLIEEASISIPEIASSKHVLRMIAHNPDCFWGISKRSKTGSCLNDRRIATGFAAFLPLNTEGYEMLLRGEFDTACPDPALVCRQHETPEAIYFWCLFAEGDLAGGVALMMEHLKSPKYRNAPVLGRPIDVKADKFFSKFGFVPLAKPANSFQEKLRIYERQINAANDNETAQRNARVPPSVPTEKKRQGRKKISIVPVTSQNGLAKVFAIRAATYMSEQYCPYAEEYDGNDFCATHLLGYVDGEPAACIRIRYFADFVKIERLAVRANYRNSRAAGEIVKAALEHARLKGFRRAYGHVPHHLERFWGRYGLRKAPHSRTLKFSDIAYTEVFADLEMHPGRIAISCNPHVILRPEGEWGKEGVLETSASRPEKQFHNRKARTPRNMHGAVSDKPRMHRGNNAKTI